MTSKAIISDLSIGLVAVILIGCGTTSSLKAARGNNVPSLQKYNQVSVLDFADKTKNDEPRDKMREYGRHFADLVAVELLKTNAFGKVDRVESPQPGSLALAGDITRCTEGSSALRYWVGMGAGSSYLDATLRFSDADSSEPIGEIVVDKNSWALGGGLAAGQTVQKFMEGAAKKVANQLAEAKHHPVGGK
jgi:hypothetical protein